MERKGDEIHITTEEAAGGAKPGVARYILLISLLLVIVAMAAIWITGALNSPDGDHGGAVTNQAAPTPGP